MDFSDIMTLVGAYAGYTAAIFVAAYGAAGLWGFFKSLAAPDYRRED